MRYLVSRNRPSSCVLTNVPSSCYGQIDPNVFRIIDTAILGAIVILFGISITFGVGTSIENFLNSVQKLFWVVEVCLDLGQRLVRTTSLRYNIQSGCPVRHVPPSLGESFLPEQRAPGIAGAP